jgi:hypothetical protein
MNAAGEEEGTTMSNKSWTHKVVKFSRGERGVWFAHPTAATFDSLHLAAEYAAAFAAEQAEAGVRGAKICVLARRGLHFLPGAERGAPGAIVATYWPGKMVPAPDGEGARTDPRSVSP